MSVVAVIDIGTNTTRLLVKDSNDGNELAREIRITGLGKALETTGALSSQSMDFTRSVVEEYVATARKLGATSIHIFATAASRRATNGREFIDSLQSTGATTEIISGETEGECAFAGATSGIKKSEGPCVVFDIGGGSTEFALSSLSDPSQCAKVKSIPVGSVVMTSRYMENDPPAPEELVNVISETREYLKEIQIEMPEINQKRRWIGVAATVTTTAAVELGLAEFDATRIHEFVLTRDMVEDVFRTLATETLEDRKFNPGLEAERADVIVGGVAIIVAIMRHFELKEIITSCTDLLDGLWLRATT